MIYYSRIELKKNEYLILEDKTIILLLTPDSFLYIVDGELYHNIKISSIKIMEFHKIKDLYFLCFASNKKNFSVPGIEFSDLACFFNAIEPQNDKLPGPEGHGFEIPEFINKTGLV